MRFGTKTLLIVVGVVSLWLSTFTGYRAASEVRASILFVGTFAAGFAAIYSRGSRRAFWSGFVGTLLALWVDPSPNVRFVPSFRWYDGLARQWATTVPIGPLAPNTATDIPGQLLGRQGRLYTAIGATCWTLSTLTLATVVGLVGAVICHQLGRARDNG
jgi:hypothetical protein